MSTLATLAVIFLILSFIIMLVYEGMKVKKGKYDKPTKIVGWIGVGSASIAAILGIIDLIIQLV